MISKGTKKIIHKNTYQFCNAPFTPLLFGNGKQIISLSRWWDGTSPRPNDYYVEDKLEAKLSGEFKIQNGIFRVVFTANLSDPSMSININQLKKSSSLNQLLQLSAAEKQQLVQNPSTIIIRPIFSEISNQCENQISKNMLQLDKLFEEAVGLKTAYLINAQAITVPNYLEEIKKRYKAVSADVALNGKSLEQVVFDHGHKLEHVFYSDPFVQNIPKANFSQLLGAMQAIGFKGKLILSGGSTYDKQLELFQQAAKKAGFSQKLQFALQNDGWYTMT